MRRVAANYKTTYPEKARRKDITGYEVSTWKINGRFNRPFLSHFISEFQSFLNHSVISRRNRATFPGTSSASSLITRGRADLGLKRRRAPCAAHDAHGIHCFRCLKYAALYKYCIWVSRPVSPVEWLWGFNRDVKAHNVKRINPLYKRLCKIFCIY